MRTVEVPSNAEEMRALLAAATRGEQIAIARDGTPSVLLGPFKPFPVTLGLLRGLIVVPPWFDDPLPPEVLAGFEGRVEPPEEPAGEAQPSSGLT